MNEQPASLPQPEPASVGLPQPIILTEGRSSSVASKIASSTGRGFFATLGLLVSGWFLGNLILVALLSVVGAFTVGSTGLVRMPVLTNYFFEQSEVQGATTDDKALTSAQEKLSLIAALKEGQTLKNLVVTEEELNALLNQKFQTDSSFPLTNTKLDLTEGGFIFTGNIKETTAPVYVVGVIAADNLLGKIEIASAKFGKMDVPTFFATNILDSYLEKVDLSLNSLQIPAQTMQVTSDHVLLEEVVNPEK